jgi:hypothetical protein
LIYFDADATISGDGTSHKHIQFESRHMMVDVPTYEDSSGTSKENRFLGLGTALNHTSEAQLEGWKSLVREMHQLYNASPRGQASPVDEQEFFVKVVGMITDHAADQKKLAFLFETIKQQMERELHGERALLLLSPLEILKMICELNEEKIQNAGGQAGWDSLPAEEQDCRNAALHGILCQRYGQELFDALFLERKREVDLFVWAGCCMHKDLNAHKGMLSHCCKLIDYLLRARRKCAHDAVLGKQEPPRSHLPFQQGQRCRCSDRVRSGKGARRAAVRTQRRCFSGCPHAEALKQRI